MNAATVSDQVTIGDASYEIVNAKDDAGLLIVRTPEDRLELWERVADYRGETMTFSGATYRFLRSWKGAGNGT